MLKKSSELKAYVRGLQYAYPINLSEDGKRILVTTYMRPGNAIIDFHDLCKRIGFGIDPKSGYLFDGTNEPGHEKKWTAYLYGAINRPYSRVTAIAGFNPNLDVVEVTWNGSIDDILKLFDTINEGELITPETLREISKASTIHRRVLIWALWKFSCWSQRKAIQEILKG